MKQSIALCGMLALCLAGTVHAQATPPKAAKGKTAAASPAKGKANAPKPQVVKAAAPKSEVKTDPLTRAQDRAVENYKRNRQRASALEKQRAAKAVAVREKAADKRSRAIVVSPAAEAKRQAAALAKAQDYAVLNYRRNMGLPVAEARPSVRRENLTCFSGTEDRHARIGVELVNNQVNYFAYYSKWKPRTCSIEARRGGPFNKWTDNGSVATVRLVDEKGMLRIERKGNDYRFAFIDVDRGRYCGMDGKINGSLTVTRGKRSCVVQGIMDGHAL